MSAGGGGRGGLSGWALSWAKNGVVVFGVVGVAFGAAAAYALAKVVGVAVGVGIAALILAAGAGVGSLKSADIKWGDKGISVGSPSAAPTTEKRGG